MQTIEHPPTGSTRPSGRCGSARRPRVGRRAAHGRPERGARRGRDDRRRRSGLDGRAVPARGRARDGASTSRARPVPRHVANVRSDTRAVLGVVGEGYEPLQNRAAFAFCDGITDSGRAHWIGAGSTRGGARVHALMRLDREVRNRRRGGEEVLPLLCFRNGHDGGLAVTVSVAPFRLACLNGMLSRSRTRSAPGRRGTPPTSRRARRRAPHARHRLALLRRAGGDRRAADPRADRRGRVRALPRPLVPLPEPKPDRSDGGRAVRNAERVREAIRTAYRAAPDLADIRGTRWGALQAVTAYVDHTQPTRQTAGRTHAEARFERATEPQPLKDPALELLTEGGTSD